MPRKSRIDTRPPRLSRPQADDGGQAPGALHHIIARGIERCKIFRDKADRNNFLDRLGGIVMETNTGEKLEN
jgi:hypothetical protein